jgi:chorismate mutase
MPDHATTEAASDVDNPAADHRQTDDTEAADAPPVDLGELRHEIDYLDAEILRLVQRRTAVSKAIGKARRAAGGPRVVHGREMAVLDRYRELGPEGHELAMLLLRLGRGRLGR